MHSLVFLSFSTLAVLMAVVETAAEQKQDEPKVEILSSKTDMERFSFKDENARYVIVQSASCGRPVSADTYFSYHVHVFGVGVNVTTGTFEKCGSQPIMSIKKLGSKLGLEKLLEYVPGSTSIVKEINQEGICSCADVESWWRESIGSDLPSWCTFFSVVYMWYNGMTHYRDLQMNVNVNLVQDLLIFKHKTNGVKVIKRQNDFEVARKLIDDAIIGKKIPTLFQKHRSKFRATMSHAEPVVEVLSNETDMNKFLFERKTSEDYYAIVQSADCRRLFAADIKHSLFVFSVGVNTATNKFETCEPNLGQVGIGIKRFSSYHIFGSYFRLYKIAKSESHHIKRIDQTNRDGNCADVESRWREVYGTNLPSSCTFFSVIVNKAYSKTDISNYRDVQADADHGTHLLIFKPLIERITAEMKDWQIALTLLEDTIINKKMPKSFLNETTPQSITSTDSKKRENKQENKKGSGTSSRPPGGLVTGFIVMTMTAFAVLNIR